MRKILLGLLLFCSCTGKGQDVVDSTLIKQDSITIRNIQMDVWALPFKYKDIVVAQAILETGWFKSKNFRVNNNLFGMRYPHTRVTCSDTSINGYAHYPNWHLSIIDYYLLQSVTESIVPTHSREQYYRYLDRIYSEVGRSYSSQLKYILQRVHLETEEDVKPKTKHVKHHKITHKKTMQNKW